MGRGPVDADFWHRKPLAELDAGEWERVCDGCGRCCLLKLRDDDSGEVRFTRVACRLLDTHSCRCRDYSRRQELVADCVPMTLEHVHSLDYLPTTCAYRLLAEGRPLPGWHPLVTGDPDSVHAAGMSVRGRVLGEDAVHPDGLHEHVVRWVTSHAGKVT
jgi:hypothetical protein